MADVVDVPVIPLVCYDEDLCRLLQISQRTLRRLRSSRAFPIPELPSLDHHHRYSRVDVLAYVSRTQAGKGTARVLVLTRNQKQKRRAG